MTFALSHHQEIFKPRLSDASLRGKPSREGVCGLAWAGGGRSRRQGPLVPALAAGVRAQAPRGPAAVGREHPDGAQALAAASERDPQGPLLGKRHLHRSQRRCPVPAIVPRTPSFLNAPGAGTSYGHAAPASASPSPRGAVAGARLGLPSHSAALVNPPAVPRGRGSFLPQPPGSGLTWGSSKAVSDAPPGCLHTGRQGQAGPPRCTAQGGALPRRRRARQAAHTGSGAPANPGSPPDTGEQQQPPSEPNREETGTQTGSPSLARLVALSGLGPVRQPARTPGHEGEGPPGLTPPF